ncbi:MAG: nuclear transport factor 2 family protein [Solirubrobacteraceae bacterium]
MTGYYHLCFAVPDLARAMDELERGLGVRWSPVRSGRLHTWDYEIVFSRDGPPFFELICGPPGSPWDASAGSRCDHIGYWSADVERDKEVLAERGLPVDFDASPLGRSFTYHRLDSLGIRVELVDETSRHGFVETWAPSAPPMDTLDLTGTATPTPGLVGDDAARCRAVLVDFLAAIDHGRATEAVQLFTDDARLTARGERLQGRAAIAGFLAEREAETGRQTVHVIANEITRRLDADHLQLEAVLVLHVRAPDGGYPVERILDTTQTFRHTDAGWQISDRDVSPRHPA